MVLLKQNVYKIKEIKEIVEIALHFSITPAESLIIRHHKTFLESEKKSVAQWFHYDLTVVSQLIQLLLCL